MLLTLLISRLPHFPGLRKEIKHKARERNLFRRVLSALDDDGIISSTIIQQRRKEREKKKR